MSHLRTTGERVGFCRHASGIGVARLADATGIDLPRLRRIESGIVEPTRDEVIALPLALGVGANVLRPGTTKPVVLPEALTTDERIALIFDEEPVAGGER